MSDMQMDLQNENTQIQTSKKSKKKKIIWIIIGTITILIILAIVLSQTVFLSDAKKDERIVEIYFEEGQEAAYDAVVKYYGSSSDKALSWIMAISSLEDKELAKQVEIVDQDLTVRSSGNYFDYEVTVKNNSKETLRYIKVNIYLKDAGKNIIYSDWTNWSGSLPPGSSTVIDTMIPYQDGVYNYSVSVADVS